MTTAWGDTTMSKQQLNRRTFLAAGTAGAAALGASAVVARGADDANSRLSIGVIGTGGRGGNLMSVIAALAEGHAAQITALCDVWQPNLDQAAHRVRGAFGKEPRRFTRFQELLARADVDAVVIATADFSHGPILVAALEAGKDVYVEKPMCLDVADANRALDLARERKRVVQVGTQFRSHSGYAAAADVLSSGVLGEVSRISASANFNHARWARPFDDCREADVDWDAYLLDLPKRPFDPKQLRRWHLYREFTNGLSGLWMSHYVDAVHKLTGAEYPSRAAALGGAYVWKDGREHCDTFHALIEYPDGFLFDWGMGLGNASGNGFVVYGTNGQLEVSKNYIDPDSLMLSPAGGAESTSVEARKIEPESMPYADVLKVHLDNWLTCLRSRKRPNADIQFGHQHAVATIMTAAALHSGQRQTYDPQRRAIEAG